MVRGDEKESLTKAGFEPAPEDQCLSMKDQCLRKLWLRRMCGAGALERAGSLRTIHSAISPLIHSASPKNRWIQYAFHEPYRKNSMYGSG